MIPTYEEALKIVEGNPNFYEKKEKLPSGVDVSIFGHRLATYTDFYKDGEETSALELRGISYVHGEDPEIVPALKKFFNLNQTPGSMLEDFEGVRITRVQEKLDGSLINFIYDPILSKFKAKSKMTMYSDQALMADEILERDRNLRRFLKDCHHNNFGMPLYPTFELVSPFNKIVLDYPKTELRLIQLRRWDGSYIDFSTEGWSDYLYNMGIKFNHEYPVTFDLDYLMKSAESETDREGWVVTFENGKMVKIKTKWYFELHRLVTENLVAENGIIELVLNETFDDVISQIPMGDNRRVYAEDIANAFTRWYNDNLDEVFQLKREFVYNGLSRKDFALRHKSHPMFGVVMASLNDDDAEKFMKEFLLKRFRKLSVAKSFVENTLNISKNVLTNEDEDVNISI